MGRGNIKTAQRHCAQCNKLTSFECNSMEWGAGDLLMILVTVCLWLVVKVAWDQLVNPWRCSVCGERSF